MDDRELAELESERDQIEADLASIRAQIEAANSRVWSAGEYSDPNWYARAKAALRFKGARHQQLLRMIGDARREQRRAKANQSEAEFIRVAKRLLDPATVDAIWAEVREAERQRAEEQ
jgi:hypothetical protein